MSKVVIFDLDGTICDCTHRLHLIKGEKKYYKKFHAECINDAPISSMLDLLDAMDDYNEIVYCTTRPDSSEELTREWLEENVFSYSHKSKILMRKSRDHRPDHVIKLENLKKAGLTPDKVLFIIEDRARVVEALRGAGYKVLQCAEGDY